MTKVLLGLDLVQNKQKSILEGKRLAILGNQASCDSNLNHILDIITALPNVTVLKLFAPEHGFRGELQDMEEITHSQDKRTGLPIISLYGSSEASLTPRPEDLEDIDAIVFDLQEVGSRYYTYAQTLRFAMEACKDQGKEVIVLDRPNPIGDAIEGAPLEADCRSFCGYAPVANRHGMTIGELAVMMNEGATVAGVSIPAINVSLTVVKMEHYKREMYFDETGVPWVIPSPNMPTLDTAIVYPGMCLIEATDISEARGTTRPFELVGASFIDGFAWKQAFEKLNLGLEGFLLRPTSFVPKFQKSAGKYCGGLQIHVTDRATFKPYRVALGLIYAVKTLYPQEFSWRNQAYEFVDKVPAIDLLHGSHEFRKAVETGSGLAKLFAQMTAFEKEFSEARKAFLLY